MASQTPYAKMFGHAPASLGVGRNHSGLTPLGPPPLHPSPADLPNNIRRGVEEYQKTRLRGFTTQMLFDVDAITNRDLNPSDLQVLNPLFQRHRWVRPPQTFLDSLPPNHVPSLTGVWNAHIDSIWTALHPCLCLASAILERLHNHPWFEALLIGDQEPIREDRLPAEAKLNSTPETRKAHYRSFKLKPPGSKKDCRARQAVICVRTLDTFVKFDFMDGNVSPTTGKKHHVFSHGLTSSASAKDIRIYLAKQQLAPLLRNDLSSSQRLAEQLAVAQTMLHEVIHAYNKASDIDHYETGNIADWRRMEPFFEDEQSQELGFSAEYAIFGGIITPFIGDYNNSKPHLGYFHGGWPDPNEHYNKPQLINPPPGNWRMFPPLPVTYYEMIQSDAFWKTHFRSFGSIRPEKPPLVAIMNRADPQAEWSVQKAPPYGYPKLSPVEPLIQMTPQERTFYDNKMKAAMVKNIALSLSARNAAVTRVVDQGEVCQLLKGTTKKRQYIVELETLLSRLRLLVRRVEECVKSVKDIESGGEKRVDVRNNILSFQHILRRFIRGFKNCGDDDIDKRLVGVLRDLEASAGDLDLQPAALDVYSQDAALREEQRLAKMLRDAQAKFDEEDMVGCRNDCINLMGSLGASMIQTSRARLLYARIQTMPAKERRLALDRALFTMQSLLQNRGPTEAATLVDFERAVAEVRSDVDAVDGGAAWTVV